MAHTSPWKGYAILGNGKLTAVYSDDSRISAITHHKGIQHLYFENYTADYIASTNTGANEIKSAGASAPFTSVVLCPAATTL